MLVMTLTNSWLKLLKLLPGYTLESNLVPLSEFFLFFVFSSFSFEGIYGTVFIWSCF